MSLANIAQHLSTQGRGNDSMLVHMTPREVAGLQTIAQNHGGSLTVNPSTGLPEAGFLDGLFETVAPIGIGLLGSSMGFSPLQSALGAGLLGTVVSGGDLSAGISAGLGAYGGAGLGGSLMKAGAATAVPTPSISSALGMKGPELAINLPMGGQFSAADAMKAGASAAMDNPWEFIKENPMPFAGAGLGLLNAMGKSEETKPEKQDNGAIEEYSYSPNFNPDAPNGLFFDPRFKPTRTTKLAEGGLTSLPPRYLQGAGDGLSDSIPATIDGKQPAALATGEFVVSADAVSALGNGSSEAGAKKLYAMMDRIRHNAHGSTKQIRKVNEKKVLPR